MAKKSEIIGEYILTINDDNSVNVSMIPDNTKEELRKIAEKNNIAYDDKLTTHQLGALILKELGKKGENTLTFGEYEIEKEAGGRINLLKTYGNTKEGLRQISKQIGFEYNKDWNTRLFGSNLMNFIVKRDEEVTTTPGNFVVNTTTTVGDFNKQFQSLYGGYLKIYNGRSVANEDEKLVDIGARTGEFSCRASRTVGSFVEAMKETFGLKVKVWTADEWVTVLDGITLSKVRDLPKQATKSILEAYESYKRENKKVKENADKENGNKSDCENSIDIPKELVGKPLVYIEMEEVKNTPPLGYKNETDYLNSYFSKPGIALAYINEGDSTKLMVDDSSTPAELHNYLVNDVHNYVKRQYVALDDLSKLPIDYVQSRVIISTGFDFKTNMETIGAGLNKFYSVKKPLWYYPDEKLNGLIFCLKHGSDYSFFDIWDDLTFNLLEIDKAQFDRLVEIKNEGSIKAKDSIKTEESSGVSNNELSNEELNGLSIVDVKLTDVSKWPEEKIDTDFNIPGAVILEREDWDGNIEKEAWANEYSICDILNDDDVIPWMEEGCRIKKFVGPVKWFGVPEEYKQGGEYEDDFYYFIAIGLSQIVGGNNMSMWDLEAGALFRIQWPDHIDYFLIDKEGKLDKKLEMSEQEFDSLIKKTENRIGK